MVTIFVVFCCKFVVYAHFLQLASLDELGNNLFHFCNHLLPKFVTFATATNLLIFNGLTSFSNIGYKIAKFWNEKDRGVVGRAKTAIVLFRNTFAGGHQTKRWPCSRRTTVSKKQNYEILERCVRIFEQRLLLWCVGRYIHLVGGLASDVYHILNHLFPWGDLHLTLDAAR